MSTTPSEPDRNDQDNSAGEPGTRAKVQVAIGMAAIIGVFTALGVEGELLARLMRNAPAAVTVAFILALLGVAAGLIATAVKPNHKAHTALRLAPGVLVAAGAICAVWIGVDGVGVRDQPTLHVTPLSSTAGNPGQPDHAETAYKITANGTGLASGDRMLLRVSGFHSTASLTTQQVWNQCSSTAGDFMTHQKGGEVLASNETGPSLSGATTSELTVRVNTDDYRWVCAHAILSRAPGEPDQRFVTTLLDTRYAAAIP